MLKKIDFLLSYKHILKSFVKYARRPIKKALIKLRNVFIINKIYLNIF